jgi:hypothetical protein
MDIDKIQSIIEDFGSDNLSVFGGEREGGIFLQQIPDELAPCVYDLMSMDSGYFGKMTNYLEIGAAAGGTAFVFDHFLRFENMVLIDNNKLRTGRYRKRKEVLKDVTYKEFIGDSHSKESLDFVKSLDMIFDVILIDGDHSFEGVKKDIDMYSQFLNYCGYLILHDIVACPGVRDVFNELKYQFLNNDFKLVGEYVSKSHEKPLGIGMFQSFYVAGWYRPIWR